MAALNYMFTMEIEQMGNKNQTAAWARTLVQRLLRTLKELHKKLIQDGVVKTVESLPSN